MKLNVARVKQMLRHKNNEGPACLTNKPEKDFQRMAKALGN